MVWRMMVRYGDALARQPTVERSPIVYCLLRLESGSGRLDVEWSRFGENNNDERLKLQEAEVTSGCRFHEGRRGRKRAEIIGTKQDRTAQDLIDGYSRRNYGTKNARLSPKDMVSDMVSASMKPCVSKCVCVSHSPLGSQGRSSSWIVRTSDTVTYCQVI